MTSFSLLCFPGPGRFSPVRVFVASDGEERREAGVLLLTPGQITELRERLGAPRGSAQPAADARPKVSIDFWTCPVWEHGDRWDASGWPVETVRWEGDVAYCTAPDCGRTSADRRTASEVSGTGNNPNEEER